MNNDNMFQFILDSIKREKESMERLYDSLVRVLNMDYEKIYADYASGIGKPKLSKAEKKQALYNHILAQSKKRREG